MSKHNEKMSSSAGAAATAPPADVIGHNIDYNQRAPPPTYEESLRMASAPPQPYQFPSNVPYQQGSGFPVHAPVLYPIPAQQQPLHHLPMQQPHYTQPPQYVYPAPAGIQQPTMQYMQPNTGGPHVLQLAKGAAVRTTATGAVTIPPPPPGVAPTPAQMAAMTGQSVVVKTKKRSLF